MFSLYLIWANTRQIRAAKGVVKNNTLFLFRGYKSFCCEIASQMTRFRLFAVIEPTSGLRDNDEVKRLYHYRIYTHILLVIKNMLVLF